MLVEDTGAWQCVRRHPSCWARVVVTALTLMGLIRAANAIEPAYSFRNPFDPEQCDRAIRFAERRLEQEPTDPWARQLRAEGLLCRGLDDDPWALDEAIALLREIVADKPDNFFAQLALADALRKRFPASGEAQAALRRARELLAAVDDGPARAELAEYLTENAAAITAHRSRVLALVREREGAFAAASPQDVAALVRALPQTGPAGIERAEQHLEVYLMEHDDAALRTLYRAELMRGRAPPARCRMLYADAVSALCAAPPSDDCALAQRRLAQLDQRIADRQRSAASAPWQSEKGGLAK